MLNEYLRFTRDSSAANQERGKERLDHYVTFLFSEASNYVVERTKYGDLKQDQRSYLLMPDYIKVKRVRVYIGGIWYLLEPILNYDKWAEHTSLNTTVSIPTHYTILNEQGNMHLELDGVPDADSDNSLEVLYEGYQNRLLFPTEYATGTIAINNDEVTIAGTGTAFTSSMINRFIRPTNGKYWYELDEFGSTLAMSLVNKFQETSISASTYVIAEVCRLPSEYHYTPIWAAAMDYYRPVNRAKAKDFEEPYVRELLMLQNKYKSKTKGRITPGTPVGGMNPNVPRNYPKSRIG